MKETQDDAIAEKVERLGRLDKRGTFTGAPRALTNPIFDEILSGGSKSVGALVDRLKEVDDGADWKFRYALHGIAQYLGGPGKAKVRGTFSTALASQLGGDRPKPIQEFIIRQLQVVGGKEVVPALAKALLDPDLYDEAAQALLAIGDGNAEAFRAALPKAKGRVRMTIVHALGVLADATSAGPLRKAATDDDRDTRMSALWALGRIGDPGAVDLLIKASDEKEPTPRRLAADACLSLAENLLKSGDKKGAVKIYAHLRDSRIDESEEYLQEIAEEALAAAEK